MQETARETDFELSNYFTLQKDTGNLAEPETVARKILLEISRRVSCIRIEIFRLEM